MSNLNRKQFDQPALFDTHSMKEPEFNDPHWNNWFENSIRAERALAGGAGKVLDKEQPHYRQGVPRPGGGAIPGQMVMGETDLAARPVKKMSTNPFTGDMQVRESPAIVEGHGTVHNPEMPHHLFRAWGPQFGRNRDIWAEHATDHMLHADSPVESAQPMLRYDPATGGKWQRSVGNPMYNQTHTQAEYHEGNPGIQGDLDFSDPMRRPAILKYGGHHYVVDGHHRLYEARSRGMEHIPVRKLDADKLMQQHGYDESGRSPAQQRPSLAALGVGQNPEERGAVADLFSALGQHSQAQRLRDAGQIHNLLQPMHDQGEPRQRGAFS